MRQNEAIRDVSFSSFFFLLFVCPFLPLLFVAQLQLKQIVSDHEPRIIQIDNKQNY